jgi:RNA polymerase sigma factor (sigma-70 family)
MARLQRGEDSKIDKINDLVAIVKGVQPGEYEESMQTLLNLFKPMMLKVCKKWSDFFESKGHRIKPFDELMSDAEYWFIKYTLSKYTIDGRATYNKFITDHVNQRIRYICECELKYYCNTIFPDQDRASDDDDDMLETVIYRYSSDDGSSLEDDYIDGVDREYRVELAHRIMELIDTGNQCFNEREKLILKEILCNGKTHEQMGRDLVISRTRVTQILRKAKVKLYRLMDNDQTIWDLIQKTDIPFDEQ